MRKSLKTSAPRTPSSRPRPSATRTAIAGGARRRSCTAPRSNGSSASARSNRDDRGGATDRLVPGLGRQGPADGLDPEPAGLVPLPAAVLGNPAPDLAVHEVYALDPGRLVGGVAEGPRLPGRDGPAPTWDRPGRPPVSRVPSGHAAHP